jgi:DNA-binding NarL/FixJ family response regulator
MTARQRGGQTTVALISGHHLLRLGLQERIKSEPWIRLTQTLTTGVNVDELILHDHPDVIIVDCQIKNDLRALVQRIKGSDSDIKIILLCDMDKMDSLRQTLGAVIDAIVLKVQPAQVLFATIRHLMDIPKHSTSPMGTAANRRPLHTTAPVSAEQPRGKEAGLTDRERHIVRLVVEGLSNKEIAARLHLADTTVRHHLTKIFDKLGVSNRQNLLIHAHRHGIE